MGICFSCYIFSVGMSNLDFLLSFITVLVSLVSCSAISSLFKYHAFVNFNVIGT